MDTFPSKVHQFRPGGPGGPGRPRKHPRPIPGTPWADYRQPDADLEALADLWARQMNNRQWTALRQLLAVAERPARDELEARFLTLVRRRLGRSTRPATT